MPIKPPNLDDLRYKKIFSYTGCREKVKCPRKFVDCCWRRDIEPNGLKICMWAPLTLKSSHTKFQAILAKYVHVNDSEQFFFSIWHISFTRPL